MNILTSSIKVVLLFLFFSVTSVTSFAQKTGSYDTAIMFSGASRTLSVYVPTNYNPANKYRLMVCLHGLGDNTNNYRSALITSLNWKTLYPNTIFVFPESSTTQADYFAPEGSGNEAIIQESIDYANNGYNIDNNNIVLQGFSLGGRAALRYGLLFPTKFKGLLLNTPAIQGVKEGSNKRASYLFNFSNANKVPIYIVHGDQDIIYSTPIDSALEQLIVNDGHVVLNRIAGLGHNVPQQPQLGDFAKFFDSTTTVDYGIEVLRTYLPLRTCDGKVSGSILVRNTGKTTITDITMDFTTNGTPQGSKTFNGLNLAPYEHAFLPITNQSVGNDELIDFTAKATLINGNINANAEGSMTIVSQSTGRALPFTEGFESNTFPPAGWVQNLAGDPYPYWYDDDEAKKTGDISMAAFNSALLFDNAGRGEEVHTPLLNLSTLAKPHLTFDLSYNYHKFKVGSDSVILADTLEILISTDCGVTFTSLFKRGGADLATFPSPILNPNTLERAVAIPTSDDWQKVLIDLDNYASATNAILNFRYISGLGGFINIDNVSIDANALAVKKPKENIAHIYPNPATDRVIVEAKNIVMINVMDAGGKICTISVKQQSNDSYTLATGALSSGIYYVQIVTQEGVQNQKLIIE